MNTQKDDRTNEVKFQELIALTQEAMERLHVPGVAIGLTLDGQDHVAGLGVTSVENPLPVTPETLFQIGSTTKTFTATLIFHLVDEGKLSLDDPVRKYLPDFKVQDEAAAAGVTIRHLLSHTCGWVGDHFTVTGWGDEALAKYVASMAEVAQLTPLGEIYTYNNAAFNVAGRVIEVVTGKLYETVVREVVLEPLEMTNSFFFPGEVMLRRFVVGHVWKESEGKAIIARPWEMARGENPCGGLVSDARDQLKYAHFHMGDGATPRGERLLSPTSLQAMRTPAATTDEGGWMGLDWFINDIGGVRFLSHGGSTIGQQSAFWMVPEKGVALTVLTNLDLGTVLHEEVSDWVREHYLGVRKEEPVPMRLAEEKLAEYAAHYKHAIGDSFEFVPSDGGVCMIHHPVDHPELGETPGDPIPPMQAAFYAPDRFVFLDPPFKGFKGEFLRGADGQIAWLRFSGRVMARQK